MDGKKDIKICLARKEDARPIVDIYAPYVRETAITFDYEVPSVEDYERKIGHVLKRYPFLTARQGEEILGYAYAGCFKDRAAYDWACELSIYVRQDQRRAGIGARLYGAMEGILYQMGLIGLYACIGLPRTEEDEHLTFDSVRFHERMGYQLVGKFTGCGYKFGRWYDMCWMEKKIRENACPPGEVRPFPQVRDWAQTWLSREQIGDRQTEKR